MSSTIEYTLILNLKFFHILHSKISILFRELKLKEVKIVQEVKKIKKIKVKQEIEDLSYSFHRENTITKLEPPSDSDLRRRSIKREPIDF